MRTRLLVIAILSIVLLLLLDTATDDQSGDNSGRLGGLAEDFDYYMRGVDSTRFDMSGRASYRIRAERFTHYPEPDHTLVEAPDLVIYREAEPPWYITARNARVNTDGDGRTHSVELSGDVVLRHEDTEGRELNIYTDYLTLYPETRIVGTDREVRLESGGLRLNALGLAADLNDQYIHLTGEGRGIYEQ